jgi:glucose-6-phosphate isomerase
MGKVLIEKDFLSLTKRGWRFGEKRATNGQHSFYQLIHQGTDFIPCDFILTVNGQRNLPIHHEILLSNGIAQTEALMKGKTPQEVNDKSTTDSSKATNHKVFSGNRPTNTFLVKELNPYNLGSLIAIYEHKTFVQGIVWNIFSFDQWGVELGKKLAPEKLMAIQKKTTIKDTDSSTNGLLAKISNWSNS